MKKFFIVGALLCCFMTAAAKGYYTQYHPDKALNQKALAWMKSGIWRNGFIAADPHATVNATDFYLQYHKNPTQWKALFEWLSKTDLLRLPKGKNPIPGTSMVASVEDDQNRDLERCGSESHYHHVDFQFVVKGVERFGIIDHYTSRPNCAYKSDAIHYDYDVSKALFYDSNPREFFLFFPGDWHIAKVKAPKQEDQNIRVVVVKVDYVD